MARIFTASLEGGPVGSALTAANTGYNFVQVGSGAAAVFAAGTVGNGARLTTGGSATFCYLRADFASTGRRYMRVYVKLGSLPTSGWVVRMVRGAGQAFRARMVIAPDGTVNVRDGTATIVAQTTAALTVGEWARVEWRIDNTLTTQTLRTFTGANLHGATPTQEVSGAYTQGLFDAVELGITNPAGVTTADLWVDEDAADDTDWPGPVKVAAAAVSLPVAAGLSATAAVGGSTRVFTESFEGAAVGTALSTTNSGYASLLIGSGAAAAFAAGTVGNGARLTTGGSAVVVLGRTFTSTGLRYMRCYVKLGRLPTSGAAWIVRKLRGGGGFERAHMRVAANGTVYVTNGSNTNVAQTTAALTVGEWARLEWRVDNTAGTQTLRIFTGTNLHGATPTQEVSGAYGQGTFDQVELALNVPSGVTPADLYVDEDAHDSATWVGPVDLPATRTAAVSLPAAVGLSATAKATRSVSVSLPVSAGLSATAQRVRSVSVSLPVAVGVTGAGSAVHPAAASLPATAGLSATTSATRPVAVSLPVSVGLSAAAQPIIAGTAAVSLPAAVGLTVTTYSVRAVAVSLPAAVGVAGAGPAVRSTAAALPVHIGPVPNLAAARSTAVALPITVGAAATAPAVRAAEATLDVTVDLTAAARRAVTTGRDITATATLPPRRWTAELPNRRCDATLPARRWAGTLRGR